MLSIVNVVLHNKLGDCQHYLDRLDQFGCKIFLSGPCL